MTNRPRFPERAEVTRALHELSNGHGVQHKQLAVTPEVIVKLADVLLGQAVLGRPMFLGNGAGTNVPHFGQLLAQLREAWPEPHTALQKVQLAYVEEAARHQEQVYALIEQAKALQAGAAEGTGGVILQLPKPPGVNGHDHGPPPAS